MEDGVGQRMGKGSKTYIYWIACWSDGDRTRNAHLGSCRKMDEGAARRRAREMKAEALRASAMQVRSLLNSIIALRGES